MPLRVVTRRQCVRLTLIPLEAIPIVVCPTCKKEFQPDSSDALPFCSERCRTIDLGRWLSEEHGLPNVPDPEADETPEDLNGELNGEH